MLRTGVGRRLGGSTWTMGFPFAVSQNRFSLAVFRTMGFPLQYPRASCAAGRRCWFVNASEQLLAEAMGSNYRMPGGNEDMTDIPGDVDI